MIGRIGQFRRVLAAAVAAALSLALAWVAPAQVIMKEPPPEARDVGLVSKLGEKVPMDLEFVNGEGKPVKLGQYFKSGKPVILALVYYRCPMICPLVLQRLQEGLNGLSYIVGEDYNCVVLSFDPSEKPAAAAEAKTLYLEGYNKPVTPSVRAGWDFLVCPNSNVRMLATAVGFNYKYIEEGGQYSHPVSLIVLTPEGKVARYVSGMDYTSDDLRMALLEASQGKIASSIGDWFRHTCFTYNDKTGKYTVRAMRVMQIGGFLTVAGLGALIAGLKAGERLRAMRRERAGTNTGNEGAAAADAAPLLGHAR
jgi:protein SCO1/2